MTLFRPERRSAFGADPFENPSVSLASIGSDAIWNAASATDAGESVTPENAPALPIVWRCLSLLGTVVASCPLIAYKEEDREPIKVPVLSKYNTFQDASGITQYPLYTPYELWELVVVHLMTWGNAYVRKIRNEGDVIVDMRPIYPGRVTVELDRKSGEKIFRVKPLDDKSGQKPDEILTTFEVMHVPGLGFDGLKGLSPIQMAMQTLGAAKAGDRLAAKFLGNGSTLSGIIKVKAPLANQNQAEGIRSRWINRHGGAKAAGDVAVLDAETDFQPLTIPPDQLQFLESRRWETTEIARLFGIPPHLVGDVEKSTSWGTGIEQQNIGFVSYTIRGITSRIEQRVTQEIVRTRGKYAEFDLEELMRGSTLERFQANLHAAGGPWLTRNEVRKSEHRAPLKDKAYDELLPPAGIGPTIDPIEVQPGSTSNSPGDADEGSQGAPANRAS